MRMLDFMDTVSMKKELLVCFSIHCRVSAKVLRV